MIVKFKYGDHNYRYDTYGIHWIFKETSKGCYDKFCPVFADIQKHVEEVSYEVKVSLLKSIVHSYNFAYAVGKDDKVREVWKALSIDKLENDIRFT